MPPVADHIHVHRRWPRDALLVQWRDQHQILGAGSNLDGRSLFAKAQINVAQLGARIAVDAQRADHRSNGHVLAGQETLRGAAALQVAS